ITTAKIKNGAVTGSKIKTKSLGTVPSAENAAVAGSIVPPEAPHLVGASGEPEFKGVWENREAPQTPGSFYKDHEGVVHLEGLAVGTEGEGTYVVFTLPSGYRPSGNQLFEGYGYPGGIGGPNLVTVTPSGNVDGGNRLEVSLAGITFRAG